MLGLLIFLPTLVYVPHSAYLLTVPTLLLRNQQLKFRLSANLILLTVIVALSFVNVLLHFRWLVAPASLLPYTALVLLTYAICMNLNEADMKLVIYLIAGECLIGLFEFVIGVKTIVPGYDVRVVDPSLLYYRSVYGLSENSSQLASKAFIAILLLDYLHLKGIRAAILRGALFVGVLVTFNRTVIVSIVFYYALIGLQAYWRIWVALLTNHVRLRFVITIVASLVILVALGVYAAKNCAAIFEQFTRRTGSLEITHRDEIWSDIFDFVAKNPLFGNGSAKYLSRTYDGEINHAHNSFLEVLASHGFIIFLVYIMLIVINIRKSNYLFVFPVIVYSFAQYGIFWGVSLMDIVFMIFLFVKRGRTIEERKTMTVSTSSSLA